jgi:hypothetical protein
MRLNATQSKQYTPSLIKSTSTRSTPFQTTLLKRREISSPSNSNDTNNHCLITLIILIVILFPIGLAIE